MTEKEKNRLETFQAIKNNPYIQKKDLDEAAYRWLIRHGYISVCEKNGHLYRPGGQGTLKEILKEYSP